MYEIIRTKNARKATYAYEFVDMFDILMPNLPEEIMAILGKDLICNNTTKANLTEKVIPDCYYILAIRRNGNYYIRRVSMHPKTKANLAKGSRKYGHDHIMSEIW